MREETRKRLERHLWLQRLKWIGGAVVVLAAISGMMWFKGLDASQVIHHRPGIVQSVGPMTGASIQAAEEGLAVDVKLEDGRIAHVMARKTTDPKVGDKVEIAEHVHGTGRVSFTWK